LVSTYFRAVVPINLPALFSNHPMRFPEIDALYFFTEILNCSLRYHQIQNFLINHALRIAFGVGTTE
jgi:hypothetical protein